MRMTTKGFPKKSSVRDPGLHLISRVPTVCWGTQCLSELYNYVVLRFWETRNEKERACLCLGAEEEKVYCR